MSLETIKIFLASSTELKDDRTQFKLLIAEENEHLVPKGIQLVLVTPENLPGALAANGFQSLVSKAIFECDLFLMLYSTKVEPTPLLEFEAAFTSFQKNVKPMIYPMHKTGAVNTVNSKREELLAFFAFKDRLTQLGAQGKTYENTHDMLMAFQKELETFVKAKLLETKPVPPVPSPAKAPLTVLFVSASPEDKAKLQTVKEFKLIRTAIEAGSHQDQFDLLQSLDDVTVPELVRAFGKKPNIVHFSGHGASDGIYIMNMNGKAQLLSSESLNDLFVQLKGITQLVVLNACYSAEQAQEISAFGMYVIGYNQPIEDNLALGFAQGLYIGLSEGKAFENAYRDGKVILRTNDPTAVNTLEVWKDGAQVAL